MSYQITIPYRFTSLNDYIDAERTNRYIAAKIKRDETNLVQMTAQNLKPIKTYPLDVTFTWCYKDARTDPDNVSFSQKFIFDGLVAAGVIAGDRWKHIHSIRHVFQIDTYERVIVELSEGRNEITKNGY